MGKEKAFYLKDQIGPDFIFALADAVQQHDLNFNQQDFKAMVQEQLLDLELKARISWVATCLHAFLPSAYPEAIKILKLAGPAFKEMPALVFPEFVHQFGMDDWDTSLPALATFTSLCSSEFAVRPFILADQDRMMQQMENWAASDNEDLRRLATEGCRPRLPWGLALKAFQKDPAPILPILEKLKGDPSEYVRRSVANNLNDISKDHPDLVLDLADRWFGQQAETDKLLKHALRGLLKQGNKRALRLFGFADPEHIHIEHFELRQSMLSIGEKLDFDFSFIVREKGTWKLRIEYAVFYVKSNGSHSKKVFQLTEKLFEGYQSYQFKRSQHFRDLTTRKHYPGLHHISLLINGEAITTHTFKLLASA
ncbi:MAG: DNA alkylation repair protein [Bacteroidota bacterium]